MNPLFNLRNLLEKAVEQEDMEPLRQCLSGKHLPVLGGNEQPADIILQAISAPSFNPELGNSLTTLLADLIDEGMKLSNNTLGDEFYVYNLFLFASYLPRNPDLFKSLKNCFQSGLKTNDYGNIRRQLRQALTYQQTDQSFEEKWLSYFENIPPNLVQLNREQRGELLEAWQGLLWIPPTDEEHRAGQVVSMDRIDRGLKALYEAISETIDDVNILRYSIRLLNDSYPRSADFWVKNFSDHIHGYPKLLQGVLENQWPMLENGKSEEIPTLLSDELKSVWKLFSSEEQIEIKEITSGAEHSRWESYWSNYITKPAPQGFSPQEWRGKLIEIRRAIESRHPVLSRRKENPGQPLDSDRDSTSNRERVKKRRGKGLGIDRLAAKDMANKVVSQIDKLLHKNDLKTAKRYLEDFVIEQKDKGIESEYIVKTLCNAATITRKRGYFDWSVEIYLQAQEEYPDDVVAHNGLAETLKAQDKFDEAEKLYRENTSKWPNDVVAHNGLAETLKAQDKFDEAETLYRENTSKWPGSVVAKHGLANILRKLKQFDEALSLLPETTSFNSIRKQYDAHLRCMVLLDQGDIESAKSILLAALKSNLPPRQRSVFDVTRVTVELKEKRYEDVLKELNTIPESPATNVFRLHALAGARHTNEANRLYNQLTSADIRIPSPVRNVTKKIEQGYFQRNIEELKTPTDREFDEVIRAEIDMLLSLAA